MMLKSHIGVNILSRVNINLDARYEYAKSKYNKKVFIYHKIAGPTYQLDHVGFKDLQDHI